MKRIGLLMLAALPGTLLAQTGKYVVNGSVGAYNAPAKAYLQYRVKGKTHVDSTVLKNGKFQFTGEMEGDPVSANVLLNPKGTGVNYNDYKEVYLERGTITIASADSMKKAEISGTKTNRENAEYELAMKPVNDAYDALDKRTSAATPEQQQSDAFKKETKKAEKDLENESSAVSKKFIQNHPDSYISLTALEYYAYSSDYVEIKPLYDGLSPAVKGTTAGKKFAERLPQLKAVALGAVAPEFAEADTSGKIVKLSSFRGKYVLIDFWASWCGPCRHENPNVVKAFNRFKNQKFTIVGVSLDRPTGKDKWLAAIHKDGLTWTQLSDLKFWDSRVAGMYAVRGIPQNFLLDPDGKIIAKNLRGDDLEAKLEELFGKI